eukprot:jgi/Botrbrau1/20773/Bobra.0156s0005.1
MEAAFRVTPGVKGSLFVRPSWTGNSEPHKSMLRRQRLPKALHENTRKGASCLAHAMDELRGCQDAASTGSPRGDCGCGKQTAGASSPGGAPGCGSVGGCQTREDGTSSTSWEGIIGREEFRDAVRAGPNALVQENNGAERLWTMEDILKDAPPDLIFEEELIV